MIREISAKILDLIYPPRCPVCAELIDRGVGFCDECSDKLTRIEGSFHVENADKAVACFEYDDAVKPAVFLMKDGIFGNAPYAFGCAIAEKLRESGMTDAELILPVPMHRSDERKRGGNQAYLIAKEVGRELGITVSKGVIVKNRVTSAQKELSAKERRRNLKGAFTITDAEAVRGRRVLLIDDVTTTGSTLSEIAGLLRSSGAVKVYCACACRAVMHDNKENRNEI